MHRGQDEVDEIIYGRSNQVIQYRQMPPSTQRYIKTRMQNQNTIHSNGMNRSSSTNRTVDVYYEDGMSRTSDNYEYVVLCPHIIIRIRKSIFFIFILQKNPAVTLDRQKTLVQVTRALKQIQWL